MGYTCIEHLSTPAHLIITMLEDGSTIGLCGECVHPWAAGIAAATDPEAIAAAKAAQAEAEAHNAELGAVADPLDEPVPEPATVAGWTHPLDRAEAEAEAEERAAQGIADAVAEGLSAAVPAEHDLEGDPADARPVETLAGALDGPDWPANEPAEV